MSSSNPSQHPLILSSLPEGMTLKEFGIMKLTAQFIAVYGMTFQRDLEKKPEFDESKFQFLNGNHHVKVYFYEQVSDVYVNVLKRSERLRMTCANLAPVFEGFFKLLQEVEEGVHMSVIDFHAVEFFFNMEYDSPSNLSMIIKPLPQLQSDAPVTLSFALQSDGITVTRKELDVIKLTAQFVGVYGASSFLQELVVKRKEFQFVKPGHSLFTFYQRICQVYSTVLMQTERDNATITGLVENIITLLEQLPEKDVEEGVEMGMSDVRTFLRFTHNEYAYWRSAPRYLSVRTINPQQPLGSQDVQPNDDEHCLQPLQQPLRYALVYEGIIIMPKELDIMKITAQFAADEGIQLLHDLMKSVFVGTQFQSLFEFMDSANKIKHKVYGGFVLEHKKKQLMNSEEKPRNDAARKARILEGVIIFMRQVFVNDVEAGVETAVNDLHGFDYAVNKWRMIMYSTPQMQPPQGSQFGAVPDERDPKKPRVDELALVPEGQFLAQYPGSSMIRVSVPNMDSGKVIEITVQSLSVNVATLKEKIAEETLIPAISQKLTGKAGVLEDNKSLAHYNVGAEDILTLTL